MERDLLDGELDAIVGDYPVLMQVAQETPGLRALDKKIEQGDYGMAVRREDTELHRRVNAALSRFKQDGTLKLLEEKWVFGPLADKVMPLMDPSLPGKPLVMGTCCAMPPFSSLDGQGHPAGLDIELVYRIAWEMGRPLEVINMDFGSLIPSLVRGEVMIIASCLSITPERQKVVRFSDSYFKSGVGAMVRK